MVATSELLTALGVALAERLPNGRLELAESPPWVAEIAERTDLALPEIFPFLSVFLADCEEFWDRNAPGRLLSDVWTQTGLNGRDRHLQASAVNAGGRHLLLIEKAEGRFEERRSLQQYAHEVETLSKKLAFAARVKSEFIATLSHEIRTPLNAVIGFGELLAGTELNGEQREYVELFQRAGTNLLTLMNDVLDLSKIEAGHLQLESTEFHLDALLDRVAETLGAKAYGKGVELACWADPGVHPVRTGDPHRLRQILLNLISNAIKFTEHGEIAVRVVAQNDGRLLFSVSDSGVGIPADKLELIFDDFAQAEVSTTRMYGGTGLGLGISRRLVELMQGRLWVESVEGRGSTFRFTACLEAVANPEPENESGLEGLRVLVRDECAMNRELLSALLAAWGAQVTADAAIPFDLALVDLRLVDGRPDHRTIPLLLPHDRSAGQKRCRELGLPVWAVKPLQKTELRERLRQALSGETKTFQASQPWVPNLAGLRILIADDSRENIFLLRAFLRNTNCEIETAGDGRTAVEKFKTGNYGLVLTDVQMPVMNGYDAVRQMRAWEREYHLPGIPILALSASGLREESARSFEAGCTALLLKPIRPETFFQAIAGYSGKHPGKDEEIRSLDTGLQQIVPWYLDNCRKELEVLEAALQRRDFEAVRVGGHNLRGTGAGYGFPELSQIGEAIEAGAMRKADREIGVHIQELGACLDQISLDQAIRDRTD